MRREKENFPEKENIVQLLGISVDDHDIIVDQYERKQRLLCAQMKASRDIRERIKLQNTLLELDDAFLEYQSSMNKRADR